MAGTPIGRILLMPQGTYNPSAVYNSLDWVRYGGASWVCKLDNTTGITPSTSATANWQLMAEDGSVGGWGTLANKPFETIGKGLTVPSSGAEQDQLKVNVDTTLLLGSKLGVNVKDTYTDTDGNPISGKGVKAALDTVQNGTTINTFSATETALSGKASSSSLDEWVLGTGVTDNVVDSNGVVTFTGIDDSGAGTRGFMPWFDVPDGNPPISPTAELTFKSGGGTNNLRLTYQTNLANGTSAVLRKLK